jgi:hypothetical protein
MKSSLKYHDELDVQFRNYIFPHQIDHKTALIIHQMPYPCMAIDFRMKLIYSIYLYNYLPIFL